MKIAESIKKALEQKGYPTLRHAAKALGISQELLRITVNLGHIPKDVMLEKIADKLGLDKAELILAAHQEKVPLEVKGYFLSPVRRKVWSKKREWPLSEEQCDYLAMVMTEAEIQMVRQFRQVPAEVQSQIIAYIDYMWTSKRAAVTEPEGEIRNVWARKAARSVSKIAS